jgi:hypothetical protein
MSKIKGEIIHASNMKMRDSEGKPKKRPMVISVIDRYETETGKHTYRFGGTDSKTGDNMSVMTKEETALAASKQLGIKINHKKMKPRKKKESCVEKCEKKAKAKKVVKKAARKPTKKSSKTVEESESYSESIEEKPKKKVVKKKVAKKPAKKATSKSRKEVSESESSESYSESSD